MKDYLIKGGELITSGGPVPNTGLVIIRGKIALPGAMKPDSLYIGLSCPLNFSSPPKSTMETPLASSNPNNNQLFAAETNTESEYEIINAEGLYISPGFIDLHMHGGGGADTTEGNTASLRKMAMFHARGGTTSFLPTIAAGPAKVMEKALAAVSAQYLRTTGGAGILGAHLEGPYLNPAKAGGQNKSFFRPPDLEEMKRYITTADGCLKMVTLAPELPGAAEIMRLLNREGIVVSAGHSLATYEETKDAIRAGMRHAVHLFNASPPLHHRRPGLVGAVLASREVSAEVIADGHHLHPSMFMLLREIKGKRNIVLVTDSMGAAGLGDGKYKFSGREIEISGSRSALKDGTLAGSTITMADAVRNVIHMAGLPLQEAVNMASLNPARVLGIEDQKGTIAPGMDADIVLLDRKLNVKLTMVQGELVYSEL
jgi:N-acetylglucosamine-6-phosphate deacetylase